MPTAPSIPLSRLRFSVILMMPAVMSASYSAPEFGTISMRRMSSAGIWFR